MDDDRDSPDGFDVSIPNVARVYDYYLGGNHNYEADREAARCVLSVAPDVPMAALENRAFLQRAARFLVQESHIAQFVDIGPGLPTQGNVHQIVRRYEPGARVMYVDNDPVVISNAKSLLRAVPGVSIIDEDLCNPEGLLNNPTLRRLINFSQPVALCMTLVLHFIPDSADPYAIITRLRDELCPGSFIVISHVTSDGRNDDTLAEITDIYSQTTAPLVMRSCGDIVKFFDGLELVKPGVVFLSQWRPSSESYPEGGTRWSYAGVGKKL